MTRRGWGWSGPLAAVLFAACLIGFAAVRPEYSHATKAVSELGAAGAPNATLFNVYGFMLPGMLVAVLGLVLHREIQDPKRSPLGPALLIVSGLSVAGAGLLPLDLDNVQGALSLGHMLMVQASGLSYALALFVLGARMGKDERWRAFGRITPWFVLFLLANIAWQVAWLNTGAVLPGWGQRIGFFGYFGWVALAGLMAVRAEADEPRG